MRSHLLLAAMMLVAGCGERDTTNAVAPPDGARPTPDATPSAVPTVSPSPAATASPAARDRRSRYTSLTDCSLVRASPEEAGFAESRCPGLGGYGLRLIDADARQDLIVVRPGGGATDLRLPEHGGGGFSSLGTSVEWRGGRGGGAFAPDAMIVRYNVVETPTSPGSAAPYLVVVSLRGIPCVTDRIAPSAYQNVRARAAADAAHDCL